MNDFKQFFSYVKSQPYTWLIIIGSFYLLPFLLFPGFNLIDDGWSIYAAQDMHSDYSFSNWKEYLLETEAGRFRPVYYLYYFVVYTVFGRNALGFWIAQSLVLIGTMILVYKITYVFTKNNILASVPSILMLFFPATADNFYRLGTAEPRQLLAILAFVYWVVLQKNKLLNIRSSILGLALFLLALGSKETSLILIPWIMFISVLKVLYRQWDWKSYAPFLISLVITGLAFYVYIPSSGYSDQYQNTVSLIKQHLFIIRSHEPFFGMLAGGLAVSFIVQYGIIALTKGWQSMLKRIEVYLIVGSLLIGMTIITLPWTYQFERYYYPCYVLSSIIISIYVFEFATQVITNVKKRNYALIFISLLFLISGYELTKLSLFRHFELRPYLQFERLAETMQNGFNSYQLSNAIIEYSLHSIPENTTIFVAHNDYEVIYEIGLFASQFGQKSVTIVSENQALVKDFSDTFPYLQAVPNLITAYEATSSGKVMMIRGKQLAQHPNKSMILAEPNSYLFQPISPEILWYTYTN